jgi:hypothetical protein
MDRRKKNQEAESLPILWSEAKQQRRSQVTPHELIDFLRDYKSHSQSVNLLAWAMLQVHIDEATQAEQLLEREKLTRIGRA